MKFDEKKKTLGQYFTNEKVAELLVALSNLERQGSAIDPMCGEGNLLEAVKRKYTEITLYGIDIDKDVISIAREKELLSKGTFIEGTAFSKKNLNMTKLNEFDLVITNPPYVRYQTLSKAEKGNLIDDIRKELLEILKSRKHLTKDEKAVFEKVIMNFSGLADLAVPSWILCMILTSIGGRISLVVPETWLNREYSLPIRFLLNSFFEIEFIVEDESRNWFSDAQIKTNLIVAKRVRFNEETKMDLTKKVVQIKVSQKFFSDENISNSFNLLLEKSNKKIPDFFEKSSEKLDLLGIKVQSFAVSESYKEMLGDLNQSKWKELLEINDSAVILPRRMNNLINGNSYEFEHFTQAGLSVGQGLRTGSNDFFYVDLLRKSDNGYSIVKGNLKGVDKNIKICSDFLLPVIRKQSELPEGYQVAKEQFSGRVLYIDELIADDNKCDNEENLSLYKYIKLAESINYGKNGEEKYIPDFSSVKTNVKIDRDRKIRDWYELPKLTQRHKPEIFVPRINSGRVKFYINEDQEKMIIDANFSTIWIENKKKFDKYSLLAILNSSWVSYNLEIIASIMGGGALKVEAAHIRKLIIPKLNETDILKLARFGKKMVAGERVSEKIDEIVNRNIFGKEYIEKGIILSKELHEAINVRKR